MQERLRLLDRLGSIDYSPIAAKRNGRCRSIHPAVKTNSSIRKVKRVRLTGGEGGEVLNGNSKSG